MKYLLKKTQLLAFVCCSAASILLASGTCENGSNFDHGDQAVCSFATNGHMVYHLATGSYKRQRVVFSAAYDGSVLCHSQSGEEIWKTSTGEGFPFDLDVADLDGDGSEEVLIASSDGALYAIDDDGTLLWRFQREAPLWQVEVMLKDDELIILTGGIERTLFVLGPEGRELNRREFKNPIRLLNEGHFRKNGGRQIAVVTTQHGLRGEMMLHLCDSSSLKSFWEQKMSYRESGWGGRFFSLEVFDFDSDGADDMVFGLQNDGPHLLAVYDGEGKNEMIKGGESHPGFNWQAIHPAYEWKPGEGIPQLPYEMNLIAYAPGNIEQEDRIYSVYGRHLIVKDRKGTVLNDLIGPAAFAGICYDPESGLLFLGSDAAAGDSVYVINPSEPDWESQFETLQSIGRLSQLEENLDLLLAQAEAFKAPEYQKQNETCPITVQQTPEQIRERYLEKYDFQNVQFASTYKYVERYKHGLTDPKWVSVWERNHSSRVSTREKIISDARKFEARGEHFLLMGGHGHLWGIDFYIHPDTMIEVAKVAPKTFLGVVFAELESTGPVLARAVEHELLPLAREFFRLDKKILLRNKNVFWNVSVHLPFWKKAFADPQYREVFVPSMEETNSRCQAWSLAGKTGLWLSGFTNHMSARAVTDNANWNRSWEWAQSRHLSHMLRSLAVRRVYGADFLHINIYSMDNKEDLLPLYLLIEKGVLPAPTRENLLSVNEIAVGMKAPNEAFLDGGTNGHRLGAYELSYPKYVFDRLDCFWGAAVTPPHDFTRLAYESKRRQMNFIPRLPYGMVTTVGAEMDVKDTPWIEKVFPTDGLHWYDTEDQVLELGSAVSTIREQMEAAAQKLPVRVVGDVAWSVIRIDDRHVRVILIDPGYFDPAQREASVHLQHLEGRSCIDILSGQSLEIKNDQISATVPLGTLCVLDIEHE